jgi:succinate dehydrogenase hydrophobic anchor subunit
MNTENALKLLCQWVTVESKHFSILNSIVLLFYCSIVLLFYCSIVPLKPRMFRSEFNKDFWYVRMLIYFLRILRRKVNGGRKTLSDLKLQIQMMSTKLLFNEIPRKCCGYAWMIYTKCVFGLLREYSKSLVIESVFECLRLINID